MAAATFPRGAARVLGDVVARVLGDVVARFSLPRRRPSAAIVAVRFADCTVAEVDLAHLGRRDVRIVSVRLRATWSPDPDGGADQVAAGTAAAEGADETGAREAGDVRAALWSVDPVDVRLSRGGAATVGAPLRSRLPPASRTAQVSTSVQLSDGSELTDARRQWF